MKRKAIGTVGTRATPAPPHHRAAGDREAKRSQAVRRLGARTVAIVVVAVLRVTFAAPAMAGAADDPASAPTTDPTGILFRAADGDDDGVIDGREAGAAGAWLFVAIDENRDGWLSRSEMKTAPDRLTAAETWADGPRLADHVRDAARHMDRDADGWIGHGEFHGFAAYLYWVADTDRSGTLSRRELDTFLQTYVGGESRLQPHDR